MTLNDENHRARSPLRALVLLYGDFAFDGRAQRMVHALQSMATVTLVDRASFPNSPSLRRAVSRQPAPPSSGGGRARQHLAFWRATLGTAWTTTPDVVVAEDFFTLFPAWLAAATTGARLIYDAHELIVPGGGMPITGRRLFWYALERLLVGRVDLLVTANPERERIMRRHYRLTVPSTFMRNIPVATGHQSDHKAAHRPSLQHQSDSYVVLYQGNLALSRGLNRFISAFSHLPRHYRLVIAGDGPDREQILRLAGPLTIEGRFDWLGRLDHASLHEVACAADVGIVTYPYKGLNNIYCAPNKLFEYALAGLPVVATDQPTIRDLLHVHRVGELVSEHDSPAAIAAKLRQVAEHNHEYQTAIASLLKEFPADAEEHRVKEHLKFLDQLPLQVQRSPARVVAACLLSRLGARLMGSR